MSNSARYNFFLCSQGVMTSNQRNEYLIIYPNFSNLNLTPLQIQVLNKGF